MNRFTQLSRAAVLAATLFGATTALADPIASSLTLADPIQIGRLSRNGIQQDWSGTETYPGVINPATQYHYRVYYFNVGLTPYIDISVDSLAATTFFSAYQTNYDPMAMATNWIGDEGSSGNYNFGGPTPPADPRFFDVVAALNSTLVLVVNESTTNGGIGQPYSITVQGFSDTEYSGETDLNPVAASARIPEPSTLLLLTPLALVVGVKSRRRRGVALKA